MIISKTPYRFSIFGGGCDYPGWFLNNPSNVLTSSMDYYCFLMVRKLGNFFLDYKSSASYSMIERVDINNDFKHPSIRECLNFTNLSKTRISITHAGDLPARSGIGSSSSFTVGLLKALKELQNQKITENELAKMACHVEQDLIKEKVGVQDQYSASLGGILELEMYEKNIIANRLNLNDTFIKEFESHILLGYTGINRNSSDYTVKLTKKIKENKLDIFLNELNEISKYGINLFKKEAEIDKIAKLIDKSWNLKVKLDRSATHRFFYDIYDVAKRSGALGGKLMGAGGGGFFYLIANPKSHQLIKSNLKNIKIWVPFKFSSNGSSIINKGNT